MQAGGQLETGQLWEACYRTTNGPSTCPGPITNLLLEGPILGAGLQHGQPQLLGGVGPNPKQGLVSMPS